MKVVDRVVVMGGGGSKYCWPRAERWLEIGCPSNFQWDSERERADWREGWEFVTNRSLWTCQPNPLPSLSTHHSNSPAVCPFHPIKTSRFAFLLTPSQHSSCRLSEFTVRGFLLRQMIDPLRSERWSFENRLMTSALSQTPFSFWWLFEWCSLIPKPPSNSRPHLFELAENWLSFSNPYKANFIWSHEELFSR